MSIRTECVDSIVALYDGSECELALGCVEAPNNDVEAGLYFEELEAGDNYVVVKQDGPEDIVGVLVEEWVCEPTFTVLSTVQSEVTLEACKNQPATVVFRHLGGRLQVTDVDDAREMQLYQVETFEPFTLGAVVDANFEELPPGLYAFLVHRYADPGTRDHTSFQINRECVGDRRTDRLIESPFAPGPHRPSCSVLKM